MLKVMTVFGTRPEVIKVAPVIAALRARPDRFVSQIIMTGQHKEMCAPYLKLFDINPDADLAIMQPDQTLDTVVINILRKLPPLLERLKPDIVLVQGDTSSAFAASLVAFHAKLPVGHIEAGLRTGDKFNPFPEEINRRLVSALADLHFAPTDSARKNLIREGIPSNGIFVTGNTVIDALKMLADPNYVFRNPVLRNIDFRNNRVICVTTHRRESFGEPLRNSLIALKSIVQLAQNIHVVLPVHYNPNVREHVYEILGDAARIHLIEPLPYEEFVQLMNQSYLILTDSGGVQEEAPSLGKPVLVLRDTTERPEGIQAGNALLVGTDSTKIVAAVARLINDESAYQRMARAVNPYGDGKTAARIVTLLDEHFARAGTG